MCPVMPERLALTDPYKQVTEMVGSGPFRFLADEHVSGSHVAYAKFNAYAPRPDGVPEWTSGPTIVHFDRVEWHVIPDVSVAAAAMQRGEMDWWERLDFDHLSMMSHDPKLQVFVLDPSGTCAFLRMNTLQPPFDNPAVRRALLGAVDQSEFMAAVVGDILAAARNDLGFFPQGSPMASEVGMATLTSPRDLDRVKRELKTAGYAGERIVVLIASDFPTLAALGYVGADMLRRCGMNVDQQTTDWGSIIQRRSSKAPVDQGGCSVFFSTFIGLDMANPAGTQALRGNGAGSWPGWLVAPKMEALRDRWLEAPDEAARKAIGRELQAQAFADVPFLPLGQYFQSTVQRRNLTGTLRGVPLFWNVRRA